LNINTFRNLGLAVALAALLAVPARSFAQSIVTGGNPDPGTGDGTGSSAAIYIPLVLALATA
jgi:hypothetical protein